MAKRAVGWAVRPAEAELCRPPDVAMMEATDFADWYDRPELWPLDRPPVRSILVEGEVGSGAVVVHEVASEDATQVALAQDEDVVETLAPDRADEAFGEGILPRAAGGREDLLDPHALDPAAKGVSEVGIAIAEEIGGGVSSGKVSTSCWAVQAAVGCSEMLK